MHIIEHFDVDHAPCGCKTHEHQERVCTSVKVLENALDGTHVYKCMACGMAWQYEPASEPVQHATEENPT